MFEGADASTMKRAVFSLCVLFIWKHGQQAARERKPNETHTGETTG